ncbi:hypothetical protein AB1Y20_000368 [Prymnesium parvum]|uniref:GST N-terminal domain-containing protein n=1 Tax=Prymnesium parvum TaxID=97485 RepID=A0AB34KA92_PRYPA
MSAYPFRYRPDDELSFPIPGGFQRGKNRMQEWVLPGSPHPPAAGRYHLFINYSCGWSHQALLVRSLKGLIDAITVSHTYQRPVRPNGWPIIQPDPSGCGFTTTLEVYNSNNPEYGNTQLTVPILFDKQLKRVVSNDPAHILFMLNEAFNEWATKPSLDLYPESKRAQIEQINTILWPGLNDDVRAFPHLIRFDLIYRQLMLRNDATPLLSVSQSTQAYLAKLFRMPEVQRTCDLHLAVVGYYAQLGEMRGLPKTIAEDDAIYSELKYSWMPTQEELEQKRSLEGLPEKAHSHLP